jgi:hypothetical protein
MSGKLSKEDYEHFVPEVERLIEQEGKIRLLFEMHDFHGWKGARYGKTSNSISNISPTSNVWPWSARRSDYSAS